FRGFETLGQRLAQRLGLFDGRPEIVGGLREVAPRGAAHRLLLAVEGPQPVNVLAEPLYIRLDPMDIDRRRRGQAARIRRCASARIEQAAMPPAPRTAQ